MLPGDWQFWDVGEVAAAAASSCGDVGLQPWPIELPEWPELSVLKKEEGGETYA